MRLNAIQFLARLASGKTSTPIIMKYSRLRPGHWFSGFALVLLMLGINYSEKSIVKHPIDASGASRIAVTAYRIVSNDEDQRLEPFVVHLPPNVEPMIGALRVMTRLQTGKSPFPPGTRVLSVTMREDGVAWADFNGALVANFPGGSAREALLLQAILSTLGQFPGVRAFQITVDGGIIETIGGHVDISEPQPVLVLDDNPKVP